MLSHLFHAWEQRLAAVSTDRVVRPFEWGLDWIPPNGHVPGTSEAEFLGTWVDGIMSDTDAFFTPPRTSEYQFVQTSEREGLLTFPSALTTPHGANNTVYCRVLSQRGLAARFETNSRARQLQWGRRARFETNGRGTS